MISLGIIHPSRHQWFIASNAKKPRPRANNENDPKIGHKKIIDGMLINLEMKAKWKAFHKRS